VTFIYCDQDSNNSALKHLGFNKENTFIKIIIKNHIIIYSILDVWHIIKNFPYNFPFKGQKVLF